MNTMIIKSKIWKNADKSETRYFVEAFRGEYEKQRGELVAVIHNGTLYKTGNKWNAKGSKDGELTAEEWQAARDLGTPTSWVAYYHPRYNDIVRGGTDYRPFDEARKEAEALAQRQAERAKRDPRLDTALDVAGYSPVGSFVTVTKKDGSETVMIVLDVYEYTEEAEQSSSDRRQSGWYMRCGDPTEIEKQDPACVALAEKIKIQPNIQPVTPQLQRVQRNTSDNEPDDELFNQLFGNGELDN